jgi:glycosyltransferase involved in cell wall biosynthesis
MKVAIVCDWYLPRIGGLELHIRDLARELNARGHEAHLVTSTPADQAAQFIGMSHRAREADAFPVHRLDVRLIPGLNIVGPGAVAPLEALLRREKFDVVHAHTLLSSLAHAGCYVAQKLGLPSLVTEHSVLRDWGVRGLRTLDRIKRWSAWPTLLTAVSSYVAEDVRAASGRAECLVLPNGIDLAEWDGSRSRPEELRVVSVMRMTRRKRPVDIVRAARRVIDRLGNLPQDKMPQFMIVGDGPEKRAAEREIDRLNLRAHVELTGWRERPFVRDLMARSAIFVLPTIKEALSIASLQALASGLPVVAMSLGGVGDIIQHGREGFLAATPEEFADCILRLVTDAPLRDQMRRDARETLEGFTWDRVIERHVECYQLAAGRI